MLDTIGLTVLPSVNASTLTSGPVRNSSMTTRAPDAPNFASFIMDATASTALSRSGQMSTPLPSARPSALTTMGISAVCKYLTASS